MKVVVVGSSNIDLVAQVDHLPSPGETVGQAKFSQTFGGKGANQAVAAARLGAEVVFVTSLGNDVYGELLLKNFKDVGIDASFIKKDAANPTGTALILVAENGENCIAVAPGANGSLTPVMIKDFTETFNSADLLVMQAEIPYLTIREVAKIANSKGVKILFNPAPACRIDDDLMGIIDILVVNEVEVQMVSGIEYEKDKLEEIATSLIQKGVKTVIVTLGSDGVFMKTKDDAIFVPAFKVKAIDTVGAGDTFCGALAAMLDRGLNSNTLQFANAAAAISVTRTGAQTSIPSKNEVDVFLKEYNC